MSFIIEPIKEYLLIGDSGGNSFTNPESVSSSMEFFETFCDRSLQSDYSPWESIDVQGSERT